MMPMREALQVVRRLRRAGHEAYLVGGCVRDLLLGAEPKDWDVATSATPEQAAPLFAVVREVGRHFGVLRVQEEDAWIEVATFRAEGAYSDGRHPDAVRFTDAREDALRRDFTVNALFLDPETNAVLDYVGGRADLEARLVRAVGDPAARFAEDALRLLRAVRFACRLGFAIEPATWTGLRREAERIRTTSAERVRDELLALLTGPEPRRGLELLAESGLLDCILPEVAALRGVQQGPRHHPEGDVWEHTLRMFEPAERLDPLLALGILLHDIGKPRSRTEVEGEVRFHGHVEAGVAIASRILERLRVPNRLADGVRMLIGQHMRFLDAGRMKKSTLRRFVLQDHFDTLLELHRLDALGSRGDLTSYELVRSERERFSREPAPMRPLLSGDDLLALGYRPGPRLGEILRQLVDAQLEGDVEDRAAALHWLADHYPAPPSPPGARAGAEPAPGPDGTPRA